MSAYSDLVLSHGAVHYWRLDETAGTTAVDTVGGATGTLTGAVALNQTGALTDGNAGMGFTGDPSNVVIGGRISTGVFTAIPQPLTLELWVKTSVPEERAMASTRDGVSQGALVMGILAGALRTYVDPLGSYGNGVRSISDGQWHHVVWVFVGSTPITTYVDGTVETLTPTQTISALFAWDRLTIGFEPSGGAKAWTGSIDDVALYPRALTPTEITQHYTVGTTVQAGVPSAGCDHTTVWSKHLATLSAPTVESERAYLANLYGEPGGTDMSTLVSRYLQAITCGTAVAPPSAPTLATVSPNTGTQGTMVTVTLTGTNFVTGATGVTVNGVGITVVNIQVTSPTTLTADLAIDAAAPPTARSITVTTAGGSSSQAFTVAVPASTLARVQAWTIQRSAIAQVVPYRCAPRPTVGNGLIVFINVYRAAPSTQVIASVVDNNSNPYLLAGTAQANGTMLQQIWYCPKLTSIALGGFFDLTITASAGSVYYVVQVVEVTGVGNGLAVDQSVGATGTSALPSTGATPALTAGTVFQAASHVIGAAQASMTVAVQSPAWTEEVKELPFTYVTGEADSRLVPSAAGTTPSVSWTDTASAVWAAGLIAFKAS